MTRRARKGPAGVLMQYTEEPEEGGTRLRVAQSGRMVSVPQ